MGGTAPLSAGCMMRRTMAGLPPTRLWGGTDLTMTALAPMMLPRPMRTPGKIVALSPIHMLSSMITGPLVARGRWLGMMLASGVPVGPCELSVMVTHRPVKTPLPMRMPENDLKNLECCYLFVGVSTGRVK